MTTGAEQAQRKPKLFYGWWIVVSMFITNFAAEASAIFSFAVFLKPMTESLDISRGTISWVVAARRVSSGVTSMFIGRVIDRYGSRVLLPIAALIAGISLIVLSRVNTFWQFLLLFIVIGLTGFTMPGNLLTSVPVQKWFVRKRGRATAFAATGFGIGGMVFVVVHQRLIDAFGWRTTWVLSGVLVLALVIPTTLLLVRRAPEDMGLHPDGAAQRATRSQAGRAGADEVSWTRKEALHTATLWKMVVAYVLVSFAMGGVQVHRIAFWQDRGYDSTLIASTFALDAAVYFVGVVCAGFLVERFHVRFIGAGAMLAACVGIAVTILQNGTWVLFFSAVTFGFGQGITSIVQVHIWPAYFGRAHVGAIRGSIVPAILIGQALGAPFAGYFFDLSGSYVAAWWTSTILAAVAALLLMSATPPRKTAETAAKPALV